MASAAELERQDEAAVEACRRKFGDQEAAKLSAELYKIRRSETAAPSPTFAGFPRWAVAALAIWVALLETADKLPRLLLAYPGYEATLAEFQAKMMQPDLVQAQLDKARNDAKASAFAPDLTAVQLDKTKLETKAAAFQPDTAAAQLDKARFDAKAAAVSPELASVQLDKTKLETKAAAFQPDTAAAHLDKARFDAKAAAVSPELASVQLTKTKLETKTASFQPALTAAQAYKAEVDSVASGSTSVPGSSVALKNMFDLLDPNHPSMVSRGLSEPDLTPLAAFYHPRKDEPSATISTGPASTKSDKCKTFTFNGAQVCE